MWHLVEKGVQKGLETLIKIVWDFSSHAKLVVTSQRVDGDRDWPPKRGHGSAGVKLTGFPGASPRCQGQWQPQLWPRHWATGWRSWERTWVGSASSQTKSRSTGSSQRSFRNERSLLLLLHRKRYGQKILLNEHRMLTPKMGKLVISGNGRKTFSVTRCTLTK